MIIPDVNQNGMLTVHIIDFDVWKNMKLGLTSHLAWLHDFHIALQ